MRLYSGIPAFGLVLTGVQPTLAPTLCCAWYGFVAFFFLFVLMTEKAKCSSSELLVGGLQPFLKFLITINVVGHVTYLNSKASITSQ